MRVLACLLALCVAASVADGAAFEERSAPQAMAERLINASLPRRDPLDLAVRLRGLTPDTSAVLPGWQLAPGTGHEESFWILDQRTAQLFHATATLRLVTNHVYWFVESDMLERAPLSDLQRSAESFETSTYPVIRKYFGPQIPDTTDVSDRIVILLGNVPGVAAYFSSADAYPRAINPRSNQHRMIYVNLNALRPGQGTAFDSTLAHEFTHLMNFSVCPGQEGWLDEGAAELGMRIAGFEASPPAAFMSHPDTQLNTWTKQSAELPRHYQASYLFLRYVAERAGGWDALPILLSSCARDEALFALFLRSQPIASDMPALFTDWAVANLLQDASVAGGRYAYTSGGLHATITGSVSAETPFLGSVPQFAANYLELPLASERVAFKGDPAVTLLTAGSEEEGLWWSNRGDSIDARLSRKIDLSSVRQATLRFQAWYDLEDQFDFVYLSASNDGGQHWMVLSGLHSSPDAATGNNFGVGWTGSSGFNWVDEEVDLTPFAGSDVLLRFDYVTDQSYTGQGFAVKDIHIAELAPKDRIPMDDAQWNAEGWVRVDAPIPEPWNVREVRWTPNGVRVDSVPVATDGSATFTLDDAATRTVLVIAPTAPRTIIPGNYSVAVAPQ